MIYLCGWVDSVNPIKFGALLENTMIDSQRNIDFNDSHIKQNTRVSYPINYIDNPKIVLLNHGDSQKCEQFANDIKRKVRLDARVPHNLETIRFL